MAVTTKQQIVDGATAVAASVQMALTQAEQLVALANALPDDVTPPPPDDPPPPAAPEITDFAVTPTTVEKGQPVELTAHTSNVTHVTLDGADITLPYHDTPDESRSYEIVGVGAAGTTPAVSPSIAVTVNPVTTSPGIPTSLTFVPHAMDPAASTNFGAGIGLRGYTVFRPTTRGTLAMFGGANGHDAHGYNGIDEITPEGVVNIRPHTVVNLGPATPETNGLLDGRGLDFPMGRDNQTMVSLADGRLAIFDGEREPGVFGNYNAMVDLTNGKCEVSDDPSVLKGIDGVPMKLEDGASALIPALGISVLYGGFTGLTDWLQIIAPNPAGSTNAYRFINFQSTGDAPSFPGARHNRYVSGQQFEFGTQLRVYGGKGGDTPTSHKDLHAVELADINAPDGIVISTNNLPDGQRVEGEAIIAFPDPERNGMCVTNGVLGNWYDNASGTWSFLPITNPAPFRVSPDTGGSGRPAAYCPAMRAGVVLWANGAIEKIDLSGTGVVIIPPPDDPPPPDTGTVNQITGVGATGLMTGTAAPGVDAVTLQFDGSEVQQAATVGVVDGAWSHQLGPVLCDGKEHFCYATAHSSTGNVPLVNAVKGTDGYKFQVILLPGATLPPVNDVPPPAGSAGTGDDSGHTPEQPGTGGGGTATPPPDDAALIPLPGNRTITTTQKPLPDEIREALNGKHFNFVKLPGDSNEWDLDFGDHKTVSAGEPTDGAGRLLVGDEQGGNQQEFRMNFVANTARKIANYFLRAAAGVNPDSLLQGALPDDGTTCAALGESFAFTSERVDQSPTRNTVVDSVTIEGRTDKVRRLYGADIVVQEMDSITARDFATGAHRIVMTPRPHCIRGDKLWRMYYDPIRDFFFGLVANGGDCSFFRMSRAGVDITNYVPGTNVPAKLNFNASGLGAITAHVAGMAIDWANRIGYFYDHYTTRLYRISIDGIFSGAEVPTPIAQFSSLGQPLLSGDQSNIKLSWDIAVNAVVLNAIGQLIVYEPATRRATVKAREDGFIGSNGQRVPSSTLFAAPEVGGHIAIGGIDNSEANPVVPTTYSVITIA